ncbi:glycoside hydrolase family 61 protein [Phanerochaete sordida]|uniref:lytic cellulose monooxygenase (C4-dehydrogenating) n=1 Tax=Phanerochaete sordida TaxID=48140 RepID=A0A9P3L8P8_9APHY|nr:glycoside hydrolase family 61 protein [Phanerochaete sordida]
MKGFLVAVAGVLAPLVAAHYTFPDFIVNGAATGDWVYIRETANHYSNGPVTDVTDPEFRCYELDLANTAGQTATYTVSAGQSVGFKAVRLAFNIKSVYHPGYFDIYMSSAVPYANSTQAGTGPTWFKVFEMPPVMQNGQLTFPSENLQSFTFTIPKSLPSGQYLIRVEHIALHAASTFQGAQFYLSCAQVNVVNGGSGTPGPLVSIPGVYTGREPGIMLNIYTVPSTYQYPSPGPAVWHG